MVVGEEEQNKEHKGFAGLASLVSTIDTSLPPPGKREAETSDVESIAEHHAASQNQQLTQERKGFAGLTSFVSIIDTSPPPPDKRKFEKSDAVSNTKHHAASQNQQSTQQSHHVSTPASSGSTWGIWVLGICVLIGLFWMVNTNSNIGSSSYTTSSQSSRSNIGDATTGSPGSAAPKFNNYPSRNYNGKRAKPVLITEFDRNFRTRINRTQSQSVNFAGEYILSTWGCGTSCLMGVAVNARTGKVITLPGSVCCWKGPGERVIFRKNSRLLVIAGLINEAGLHGAHFYELKENGFAHIKTIPVEEIESVEEAVSVTEVDDTIPTLPNAPSTPVISPYATQESTVPRPTEDMPPVGEDLTFSPEQIQYCLAEDIRLEGARSSLNGSNDHEVDRFNEMVADYNSRCGSYQYHTGSLEKARLEIESYRNQLERDGRQRFGR